MKFKDGSNLEGYLAKAKPQQSFPGGVDYNAKYVALKNHLVGQVHPHVVPANIARDGGYINDHGPDHIRKLIERLTELLKGKNVSISPYETFVLLCAAHFHDIGNMFGRQQHEEQSAKVMNDLGPLFSNDQVEKRWIFRIAAAHGGSEKDKITEIPAETVVLNQTIRPQFLAALLKFGDELAEDYERAARYPLEKGLVPPSSEIFHRYAEALHSVTVDHGAQELRFEYEIKKAQVTAAYDFEKNNTASKVYILDEIFKRTMKAHYERIYCMRFLRPQLDLNRISVTISVSDDNLKQLGQIGYRLEEVGYPGDAGGTVYDLCPHLREWKGNGNLTGEHLAQTIDTKGI